MQTREMHLNKRSDTSVRKLPHSCFIDDYTSVLFKLLPNSLTGHVLFVPLFFNRQLFFVSTTGQREVFGTDLQPFNTF